MLSLSFGVGFVVGSLSKTAPKGRESITSIHLEYLVLIRLYGRHVNAFSFSHCADILSLEKQGDTAEALAVLSEHFLINVSCIML